MVDFDVEELWRFGGFKRRRLRHCSSYIQEQLWWGRFCLTWSPDTPKLALKLKEGTRYVGEMLEGRALGYLSLIVSAFLILRYILWGGESDWG